MGARASSVDVANAVTGIGVSLKQLHRDAEAARLLDTAIAIQREGAYPFVTDTLRMQGNWYADAGEWDKALASYLEAVRVNEIDGDEEFVANDLVNASRCYERLAKWPETIDVCKRARAIYKSQKKVKEIGHIDRKIAEAYIALGNGEEGLRYAKLAYEVASLRGDGVAISMASLSGGRAQLLLGNFEKAEQALDEARNLLFGSEDWEMQVAVDRELITLYRQTTRFNEADKLENRIKTIEEILE